jgi:predicted O-methyltransferase YrrM
MLQPKNVLEIGTFTGYATLCLASGLSKDGKITTLDVNEDLAYLPKKYFEASEYAVRLISDFRMPKNF